MNDNNFLIVTKLKKTIEYIDNHLQNFPHKNIELKQRIIKDLFDTLEFCYLANNNYDKNNYQLKSIVKLSMIDYYLKISYKKDLISKKQYELISKHLLEVKKMIFAWRENEEKKTNI